MSHIRISHKSIITKLILMNLLILIAVGGVVIVNLLISRQVGDMLNMVIDKDVSRIIKNAELSRDLNKVFAGTHLLINTFTEREDLLRTEGNYLVTTLQGSIATVRETDGIHDALKRFKYTLEALLDQCAIIITLSKDIQTTERELDMVFTTLEETVTDLIITRSIEEKEDELFSIEQVSAATPDYRTTLLQVIVWLASSKQAHLGTATVEEDYEYQILTLLDELVSGLITVSNADEELAPLGKHLIGGVLRYKEHIIKLHQAMQEFQIRLNNLDNAQAQVVMVIKRIDKEIIQTTGRIRGEVAKNIQSSSNVTVFFSVIVIAVLGGVGMYAVRITRPILHLTASAAEIAAGNLDIPIDINGNDEVGRLARSFAHMRDVIQEEMSALAEKNTELIQEITERKRAEEALRESEERYRRLVELSPYLIAIHFEGKIIFINKAGIKLLGASSPDQVIGKPVVEFVIPARRDIARERLWRGLEEQKDTPSPIYEQKILRLDGTESDIEVTGIPFSYRDGTAVQIVAHDITARKQAEEQIKNQNLLLEQAVQEKQREMEAMFERLLRQEKLATIGQMAGSIAHELRNPLGAVKQSAFFLKRLYQKYQLENSHPNVQEHLDLIEAEIDTSEQVISNLLKMTRMKTPQRERTDLHPLIEDAAKRCQFPEQIQLTLDLNPEPFLIWVDPGQLRQVFVNLLTNAIQATMRDGNITVRAKQLTKDRCAVIEIKDEGIGIEPDILSKIFEPLYTTKATGTGLGLSICKQIIENHYGNISMRSEKGQGTTVTVVLPDQE